MLENEEYRRHARETVHAFEAEVEQFPYCFAGMLGSVVVGREGAVGVVVRGLGRKDAGMMVRKLREKAGVGRTVVAVGKDVGEWIKERNVLLRDIDPEKEGVMICEGRSCREVGLDGEGL